MRLSIEEQPHFNKGITQDRDFFLQGRVRGASDGVYESTSIRLLKNKYQAVSQGARRFEKRSIS
jgi:hypothetical protein